MLLKITAIALIAFIADCQGEMVWDGYSAKWAENPEDGFYGLPERLKVAECRGWTEIPGCKVPPSVKALGYQGDPRLILFFSKITGLVLGHQISFPVAEMKNVPINYNANPAISIQTLNGTDYYTASAFYLQDERTGNFRQLWVMVKGKLVEIPTRADQVSSRTSYFLKRCAPWMGQHYYMVNSTTNCGNIFPWFLLRIKNDIIGIGFQIFGTATSAPARTWFETQSFDLLAHTLPDAPACISNFSLKYGVISLHVWFKKNPLAITCIDSCRATMNSTYGAGQTFELPSESNNQTVTSGNICPV